MLSQIALLLCIFASRVHGCADSGQVIFEEYFDIPEIKSWCDIRPTTYPGWDSNHVLDLTSGSPEFQGWKVWDMYALQRRYGRYGASLGRGGVAVVLPERYYNTGGREFSASLITPAINVTDICGNFTVSFATSYSQGSTTFRMSIAVEYTINGTSTVTHDLILPSRSGDYYSVTLTPPSDSVSLRIKFSCVPNQLDSAYFWTLDDIVVRAAQTAEAPHCSDASHSMAVWAGGSGMWNNANSWCDRVMPTASMDVRLACPQHAQCSVVLRASSSAGKVSVDQAGGRVGLVLIGQLIIYEASHLQDLDLRGSLEGRGGVTVSGQTQLLRGYVRTVLTITGLLRASHSHILFWKGGSLILNPTAPTNYSIPESSLYQTTFESNHGIMVGEHATLTLSSARPLTSEWVHSGQIVVHGRLNLQDLNIRFVGGVQLTEGAILSASGSVVEVRSHLLCTGGSLTAETATVLEINALDSFIDNSCSISAGFDMFVRSGVMIMASESNEIDKVTVSGGNLIFAPGAAVSHLESIEITGGYISFDDRDQLPDLSVVSLTSSGYIRFQSVAMINDLRMVGGNTQIEAYEAVRINSFDWDGGVVTGVDSTVVIEIMSRLNLNGNFDKYLEAAQLRCPPGVSYWRGAGSLYLNLGAVWLIPEGSTLEVKFLSQHWYSSSSSPIHANGLIQNNGELRLVGQFLLSDFKVFPTVINNGTLQITSGTIVVYSPFRSLGVMELAPETIIRFQSNLQSACTTNARCFGYKEIAPESEIRGSGTVQVSDSHPIRFATRKVDPTIVFDLQDGGLTLDVSGFISLPNLFRVQHGTFLSLQATEIRFGHVEMFGGSVIVDGSFQADSLAQHGGVLSILDHGSVGSLDWTGGKITGNPDSIFTIQRKAMVCGTEYHYLDYLQFVVAATANIVWQDAGSIKTTHTAQIVINQGGALYIRNANVAWLVGSDSQRYGLVNHGTIKFSDFEPESNEISMGGSLWSDGDIVIERGDVSFPDLEVYGTLHVNSESAVRSTASAQFGRESDVFVLGKLSMVRARIQCPEFVAIELVTTDIVEVCSCVTRLRTDSWRVTSGVVHLQSNQNVAKISRLILAGGDLKAVNLLSVIDLELRSADSELTLGDTLNVENKFVWFGGRVNGFGRIKVRNELNIGGSRVYLDMVELAVSGNINVLFENGQMYIQSGGKLICGPQCTFNVPLSQYTFESTGGFVINEGRVVLGLEQLSQSSTSSTVSFSGPFYSRLSSGGGSGDPSGVVIRSGSVVFSEWLQVETVVELAQNTELSVSNGRFTFERSSSIIGMGSVAISGTGSVLSKEISVPFLALSGGHIALELNNFNVISLRTSTDVSIFGDALSVDKLHVDGHSLILNVNLFVCQTLKLSNGDLFLYGSGEVASRFEWTGGSLNGNGGTLVINAPDVNLDSGPYHINRNITFAQNIEINTPRSLSISGQGVMNVEGGLRLTGEEAGVNIGGNGYLVVQGSVLVPKDACPNFVNIPSMMLRGNASLMLECTTTQILQFDVSRDVAINISQTALLQLSSTVVIRGRVAGGGTLKTYGGHLTLAGSEPWSLSTLSVAGSGVIQVERSHLMSNLKSVHVNQGTLLLFGKSDSTYPLHIGELVMSNSAEVVLQSFTHIVNLEMISGRLRVDGQTEVDTFDFVGGEIISKGNQQIRIRDFAVQSGAQKILMSVSLRADNAELHDSVVCRGHATLDFVKQVLLTSSITSSLSHGVVINHGVMYWNATNPVTCDVSLRVKSGSRVRITDTDLTISKALLLGVNSHVGIGNQASLVVANLGMESGASIEGTVVKFSSISGLHGCVAGNWNVDVVELCLLSGSGRGMLRKSSTINVNTLLVSCGTCYLETKDDKSLLAAIGFDETSDYGKTLMLSYPTVMNLPVNIRSANSAIISYQHVTFNADISIKSARLVSWSLEPVIVAAQLEIIGDRSTFEIGVFNTTSSGSVVLEGGELELKDSTFLLSDGQLLLDHSRVFGTGSIVSHGHIIARSAQVRVEVGLVDIEGSIDVLGDFITFSGPLFYRRGQSMATAPSSAITYSGMEFALHHAGDHTRTHYSLDFSGGLIHLNGSSTGPSFSNIKFARNAIVLFDQLDKNMMCVDTVSSEDSTGGRMVLNINLVTRVFNVRTLSITYNANLTVTNHIVTRPTPVGTEWLNDRTNKTGEVCSVLTSCSSCTANASCGWSLPEGACVTGTNLGPTTGDSCDWIFTVGSCAPECASLTDAESCERHPCVWCASNICVDSAEAACGRDIDLVWVGLSGSFNHPLNWSPPRVPTSADSVLIASSNTISVTIPAGAVVSHLVVQTQRGAQMTVLLQGRFEATTGAFFDENVLVSFARSDQFTSDGTVDLMGRVTTVQTAVLAGSGVFNLAHLDARAQLNVQVSATVNILNSNSWSAIGTNRVYGVLNFVAGTKQSFYEQTVFEGSGTINVAGDMVVHLDRPNTHLQFGPSLSLHFDGELRVEYGTIHCLSSTYFSSAVSVLESAVLFLDGNTDFSPSSSVSGRGTVVVSGTMVEWAPGSVFDVATLAVDRNGHAVLPSLSVNGLETLRIELGIIDLLAGKPIEIGSVMLSSLSQFNVNANLTVRDSFQFLHSGSVLGGSGSVDVYGESRLMGGTIRGSPGRRVKFHDFLLVSGTSTVRIEAVRLELSDVRFQRQNLLVGSGAEMYLTGNTEFDPTFSLGGCSRSCEGKWVNRGQLTINLATSETRGYLGLPLYNEGELLVERGIIDIPGGHTSAPCRVSAHGQINLVATTRTEFEVTDTGSIGGSGTLFVERMNLAVFGGIHIQRLVVSSDTTVTVHPQAETVRLAFLSMHASSNSRSAQLDIRSPALIDETMLSGFSKLSVQHATSLSSLKLSRNSRLVANGTVHVTEWFAWLGGEIDLTDESGALDLHMSTAHFALSDMTLTHGTMRVGGRLDFTTNSYLYVDDDAHLDLAYSSVLTCTTGCNMFTRNTGNVTFGGEANIVSVVDKRPHSVVRGRINVAEGSHLGMLGDVTIEGSVTGSGKFTIQGPGTRRILPSSLITVSRFEVVVTSNVELSRLVVESSTFTPDTLYCSGSGSSYPQEIELLTLSSLPELDFQSSRCHFILPPRVLSIETVNLQQGRLVLTDSTMIHIDNFVLGGEIEGTGLVSVQSLLFQGSESHITDTTIVAVTTKTRTNYLIRMSGSARLEITASANFNPGTLRMYGTASIEATSTNTEVFMSGRVGFHGSGTDLTASIVNKGRWCFVTWLASSFELSQIQVLFRNAGTLSVNGSLVVQFSQLQHLSGSASVTSPSRLEFVSRDSVIATGAELSGNRVDVSSGSLRMNAADITLRQLHVTGGILHVRNTDTSKRAFSTLLYQTSGHIFVQSSLKCDGGFG